MGLLSLVFNTTQRTRIEGEALDGRPIVLEIDATTTMNHERGASPTKNPIETGSNISDHVTLDNDRLSVEGIITANPLSVIQSAQTVLSQRIAGEVSNQFQLNSGLASGLVGSV